MRQKELSSITWSIPASGEYEGWNGPFELGLPKLPYVMVLILGETRPNFRITLDFLCQALGIRIELDGNTGTLDTLTTSMLETLFIDHLEFGRKNALCT